ncbi:MAG: hypothetical protein LBH47_02110 [Christensenellaceae bacterium]|jgi:hypothetical protein|nr:hypothetical protein [Christensenellaceae bacterium]
MALISEPSEIPHWIIREAAADTTNKLPITGCFYNETEKPPLTTERI